jgi:hypothetical protein
MTVETNTETLDEQDELEQMVSYRANVTGISHTIFISPRGNAAHGPRVKVAIDPPDSLDPRGNITTITFDGAVIGAIDQHLARQVLRFIDINRAVLLDYWFYKIDTDQLRQRLQPID